MRFAVLAWTPDYAFFTHRVHHVMLGGFLVLLTASVAAQLYRPAERVGAFLFAALAVGTLTVVSVIVEGLAGLGEMAIFIAPLVVLGLLHPGLRSVSVCDRVDRRMFALAAVAAVPLVAFAAIQTKLQLTMVDDHVIFGHYTFMAAGALTIGLGALIGSLRPAGWRVLVYGIAVLLASVGVASVLYPDPVQGVNFGLVGGLLAVGWAISYVAVAELGSRSGGDADASSDTA